MICKTKWYVPTLCFPNFNVFVICFIDQIILIWYDFEVQDPSAFKTMQQRLVLQPQSALNLASIFLLTISPEHWLSASSFLDSVLHNSEEDAHKSRICRHCRSFALAPPTLGHLEFHPIGPNGPQPPLKAQWSISHETREICRSINLSTTQKAALCWVRALVPLA